LQHPSLLRFQSSMVTANSWATSAQVTSRKSLFVCFSRICCFLAAFPIVGGEDKLVENFSVSDCTSVTYLCLHMCAFYGCIYCCEVWLLRYVLTHLHTHAHHN
jgi:hypothetical protein